MARFDYDVVIVGSAFGGSKRRVKALAFKHVSQATRTARDLQIEWSFLLFEVYLTP
jgi:hypothetical protein